MRAMSAALRTFNACVAKRYFQTAGAYNKVLKTYCKNDSNSDKNSYEQGYQMGYEDGIEIGSKVSDSLIDQMKAESYASGRKMGYEDGYDDGFAAAAVDADNEEYDEGQKYERKLQKETNFEN